jgi:hypothetical protein
MSTQPPYSSPWRIPLMALGWLLITLSPFVGVLPGPGGIFVFIAGAILLLRNSAWAKRRYVALKRRFPRFGHLCDRTMRRASALRRHAISKERACQPD